MQRKTPMMLLFEYFDAMIHENIDWFELKSKALEMEANEMEFIIKNKNEIKDFKEFYEKTYKKD